MSLDKSKYVVLDVETNGLNLAYDLLSISLYLPDTNKKYERYLPLEKNKFLNLEACKINGITEDKIKDKKPITQEEWDLLVDEYELYKREILHFGTIDPTFIKEYLKRHKIKDFSKLTFHNFKHNFLTTSFSNGEYSKDNLCRGLGIEGVKEVHDGVNDCILEWKLFEKIDGAFVLAKPFDGCKAGLFKLVDEYLIPASEIYRYPNMKYAIGLPKLKIEMKEVFSLELSKKCKKMMGNCSQPFGMSSESILKNSLGATDKDNPTFSRMNFRNLPLIGEFFYKPYEHIVPVIENRAGTFRAVYHEDEKDVNAINEVMLNIKKELNSLINYIKTDVFENKPINAHELVVNQKLRAFGYTDFSNEAACLEMKFGFGLMDDLLKENYKRIDKHKYQLYICSNGRPAYFLIGDLERFKVIKVNFYVGKEIIRKSITAPQYRVSSPVIQYDQKGKKIKEYLSVEEASESLGISSGTIRDNCRSRYRLTAGYQFKYKFSDKEIKEVVFETRKGRKQSPRKCKHVIQYDLAGNMIKEYDSAKEAAKAVKVNVSKIYMVCSGKRNLSAGFKWKYKKSE